MAAAAEAGATEPQVHWTVAPGETPGTWKEKLTARFPDGLVAYKPKPTCRDCGKAEGKVCGRHEKDKCPLCRLFITKAHVDLAYIGHADVVQRLNWANPGWFWTPRGTAPDKELMLAAIQTGNPDLVDAVIANAPPALDESGGMWMTLTVFDDDGNPHAMPGYGEAGGKVGGDAMKERISDGLKNAGQRHGIATYLWSKADLALYQAGDDAEVPAGPGRKRRGTSRKPAAGTTSGGDPGKPLPDEPAEDLRTSTGAKVPAGVADLATLVWELAAKPAATVDELGEKGYQRARRSRWLRMPARPPWDPKADPVPLVDIIQRAKQVILDREGGPDVQAQQRAGEDDQTRS